jgi:hypothetical protein
MGSSDLLLVDRVDMVQESSDPTEIGLFGPVGLVLQNASTDGLHRGVSPPLLQRCRMSASVAVVDLAKTNSGGGRPVTASPSMVPDDAPDDPEIAEMPAAGLTDSMRSTCCVPRSSADSTGGVAAISRLFSPGI